MDIGLRKMFFDGFAVRVVGVEDMGLHVVGARGSESAAGALERFFVVMFGSPERMKAWVQYIALEDMKAKSGSGLTSDV